MAAGIKRGENGTAMNSKPNLSHWAVKSSQTQIKVKVARRVKANATTLERMRERRKLIRNGVSSSSRAKVKSLGIVARKAKTAPTWMNKNINEASSKKRNRLATSMGVSLDPPTSNRTRWMPAITKQNRPAVTKET